MLPDAFETELLRSMTPEPTLRVMRSRAWGGGHPSVTYGAQVIRRGVLGGAVAPFRGAAAIEILAELPIERHVATRPLPRIWTLRDNLTAYDAAYVALAEALGCSLLTLDEWIAVAPGIRAAVRVPGRDHP